LARIYPNGQADINEFQEAGGMAFLVTQLLERGLLHRDVRTAFGRGLDAYTQAPRLDSSGALGWAAGATHSGNLEVLRPVCEPFCGTGGLKLLEGNLGRAVIKVSAVRREHRVVVAPARIFDSQEAVVSAFQRGELERDFVAVVRFQGPRANGMPELHKLTPILGVLQDRGHRVALVTDGRMSGASGKVPAAIHVSPECALEGPLARVENGDLIRLDAERGALSADVDPATWNQRPFHARSGGAQETGMGRELFAGMRAQVSSAESGARTFEGAR
jgi:phosphogluconate dehydratase